MLPVLEKQGPDGLNLEPHLLAYLAPQGIHHALAGLDAAPGDGPLAWEDTPPGGLFADEVFAGRILDHCHHDHTPVVHEPSHSTIDFGNLPLVQVKLEVNRARRSIRRGIRAAAFRGVDVPAAGKIF